jgi:hypothetical protein
VIRQLEVDGVPALVASTAGPMHAGLMFRVGQADETLARRGVTHLLEHLVLHPVGMADYHYNGVTGSVMTAFHMQGPAQDITGFLTGVCRSLAALATDRLAVEKEILRTEWSSRSTGVTDQIPLWRYGARDHGLVSFPEWGLNALIDEDVRSWAARFFTRENAVLWIAGDGVPAGLRLDLPDGRRMPVPAASSALPDTPAYFCGSFRATALNAPVPRQAAATVLTGVLERELYRALRREGGLSYTAAASYEVRGDGYGVITALADALPEKQEAVLGGFVDVLAKLRVGRIAQADVDAVLNQRIEALSIAEADVARLTAAAFDLITGGSVRSADEIVHELKAVTAADVHATAIGALRTALLMTPQGHTADWAGFVAAPTHSPDTVPGKRYTRLDDAGEQLVVGAEGTSAVSASETATVRFATCAAMLAWPDGGRLLIGADGISVRVEPTLYPADGKPDGIDERVPADIRIDMPARDPDQVPQPKPASPARRWSARSLLAPERLKLAALALVAVVMGGLAVGLSVGMATGAIGLRLLPAVGIWILAGYLGRAFRKTWREVRRTAD